MKSGRVLTLLLVSFCSSCATMAENVVWWSRQSEVQDSIAASQKMGLAIEPEAFEETLKLWPYISRHGLQRRALLYTLLKSQAKDLSSWRALSSTEDFDRELAQIEKLRLRNAF